MVEDPMPGRPRIGLLWFHPLVLTEFRRALAVDDFEIEDARIEPGSIPDLDRFRGAPLFVLEEDPARGDAKSLCTAIASRYPAARIIVASDRFDEPTAFTLLRLGVKGLVTFEEFPDRLPRILREVGAGGFWVSRSLLSRFLDSALHAATGPLRPPSVVALTPRENEVLEDLLLNLSNKEIAQRRRLTSRTVKFHVSNVLAKYGVKRRADLLLLSFPQH